MTETTMSPAPAARTPWHLWVVGILALLWNALGVFDYFMSLTENEAYLASFTAEQREYFTSFPIWMIGAWTLGVWGGFLGAVALLLRKDWAVWLFGLSILGLLISAIYAFALSNGAEIYGTVGLVMTAVVWIIALFLFFYARAMKRRGVLH